MVFDGYGVALTLQPVVLDPVPPGALRRSPRLSELLPVSVMTRAERAHEIGRVQQLKAMLAAYEATLVVGLAAACPDSDDRRQGEPGAPAPDWAGVEHPPAGVSEFFFDELAMALGTSRTSAGYVHTYASALVERLPGTWTALADGELDWPRARTIAGVVAQVGADVEPVVLAAVEAAVLPRAGELTVTALKELVRAELVAHGAVGSDRWRAHAERRADVTVRPTGDGRADLVASLTIEDAKACWSTADELARVAKSGGDPRPLGLLRCEAMRSLILRPGADPDRPPVSAQLLITASLDAIEPAPSEPPGRATGVPTDAFGRPVRRRPVGHVGGEPITAGHLRGLLERIGALCPGGLHAPAGGSLRLAITDPDGVLRAVLTRPELERLVRRGCPEHPPDAEGKWTCGCAVIDRPPEVDRYRPTPAQYRFVHTRDRRCRMPGCSARSGWADLDHVVPHSCGGATDCGNLCCLCRRHHRLKTLARDWTFTMSDDGVLTVTTPSGVTRISRPPGLDPVRAHSSGTGGAGPPGPASGSRDDDPPPF